MSGEGHFPVDNSPGPGGGSEDELFAHLVVSKPVPAGGSAFRLASIVVHGLVIGAIILVPILWPTPDPDIPDPIRALIYNPPAAAAAPLPQGSNLARHRERPEPTTPDPHPQKPQFTAPIEVPQEKPIQPESKAPQEEQQGDPNGSPNGIPEGMEGGVDGGQAGGVPWGVVGGVPGGKGDGPVLDYDVPPRIVKITKPQYPQDAFVKKVEGKVVLQILIDAQGRVSQARVIVSVPLLDAAAIATVKQWVFLPALKHGHPVSTIATAPVDFRIF